MASSPGASRPGVNASLILSIFASLNLTHPPLTVIPPPAARPNGNAAGGFWPDVDGMADMPAGRCFGNLFLRIAKGLGTTRRMPGASGPWANVWGRDGRSGVTPKRGPIPAPTGRPWQRRPALAKGWLGWSRIPVRVGDRGRGRW